MANLNKVTVMGILGRDPETMNFPNGGSIISFSIATTEYREDLSYKRTQTGYRMAQNRHQ